MQWMKCFTKYVVPNTRSLPKKILLVRCDRIGDLVLTTPVISYIRQKWEKDISISILVNEDNAELIHGHPDLAEVMTLDKEGIHKGLVGTFRLVQQLRKRCFDAVFVFHPTVRIHLILFLSGIPQRIGYPAKLGRWFLSDLIPDKRAMGGRHEVENVLDVVDQSPWGTKGSVGKINSYQFWIAQDPCADQKIERELELAGLRKGERFIALHPGASCLSKRWPKERFMEVGKRLKQERGTQIVVVAGNSDRQLGLEVARGIPGSLDFSGRTRLLELASLLRQSQLLISNDSGPVHVAVAVGIPVLSIFGRNQAGLSPIRWRPLGRNNRYLHKDVGCFVCLAHRCNLGFECLSTISVEEVVLVAMEMLQKSTSNLSCLS